MGKDSQFPQGIVCYECNGHGHLKKECPNYLRGKGKVFAITLSDFESSNLDIEGECDNEGNYKAFMVITSVDSKDELSNSVDELGDLSEDEEVGESEDEDICQNEGEKKITKEEKCEVGGLKGELVEAYSKIKFLELEIFQAHVKVECISTKKLDNVLSSQKSSHDKTSLGYTR